VADMTIETHRLTKFYHNTVGVKDVDLTIAPGELVGFVGPNGAGKTTTLKMLLNIVRPSAGTGRVLGRDIQRESLEIRRRTGYMPGEPHLYEHLRGADFLRYMLSFYDNPDFAAAAALAKRFKLPLERKIRQYSSGMKQILLFIQAIAHRAELLLLDEPTKGMDPTVRAEILDILQKENASGRTIFLSSHVLWEIEQVCQRVVYIRRGELIRREEIERLENQLLSIAEITFANDLPENVLQLPGVKILRRERHTFFLAVEGDPSALLKRLSELPVTELLFRRARLEDLYRGLFKEEKT
jgi:ABC-2 type transport system ATP-binding protein